MADKQQHSCAGDSHSCSSKFVCPLSLVSLLICTAALVRVEIINQRVYTVEDLVADARQIQNLIKVSTAELSFKHSKRVGSGGKFDHKITKGRKAATEGNPFVLSYVRKSLTKPLRELTRLEMINVPNALISTCLRP